MSQIAKKAKLNAPKEISQDDLRSVLEHIHAMFTIMNQIDKPSCKNIANNLAIYLDKVPRIVTFGQQSSGKSSIINKMFPGLDLTVSNGVGTRCPIVIKSGSYLKKSFSVVEHNQHLVTTQFNSINECLEAVTKKAIELKQKWLKQCEIVIELPSDNNIIIIDLPGVNAEEDFIYFKYLENKYLVDHSIVLFAINSSNDKSNDMALKYISNAIFKIGIFTHMDMIVNNSRDESCINQYVVENFNNYFYVSDRKSVDEIKKRMSDVSSEFIGYENLKKFIFDTINTNLKKFIELISQAKETVVPLLVERFMIIGENPLNLDIEIGRYRETIMSIITPLFHKGNESRRVLNSLSKLSDVSNSIKDAKLLPDEKCLTQELEDLSGNTLVESQGYEEIVKKYIKLELDRSHEILLKYVNKFAEGFKNLCDKNIRIGNPFYSKINDVCAAHSAEVISALIKNIHQKIAQEIKDKSIVQINTSPNIYVTLSLQKHHKLLSLMTEQELVQYKRIDNFNIKNELIMRHINKLPSQFADKAEEAHAVIKSHWADISKALADSTIYSIKAVDEKYVLQMTKFIQTVSSSLIVEPEDIKKERLLLIQIRDHIQAIDEISRK